MKGTTGNISLKFSIFSEDPLRNFEVLDNYEDLRVQYEFMAQENASLKLELEDLMQRNMALQKAFSKEEKSTVNYVENVI